MKKITITIEGDAAEAVQKWAENAECTKEEAAAKLVTTGFSRLRALRKFAKAHKAEAKPRAKKAAKPKKAAKAAPKPKAAATGIAAHA